MYLFSIVVYFYIEQNGVKQNIVALGENDDIDVILAYVFYTIFSML